MNKSFTLFPFLGLISALSVSSASATLRIVATVPDLADIVRQVGGDQVEVTSLAKGKEDIHAVPQRPSFLPLLNRADAVVLIGFGLEHAFLPALLEVAQNPRILPGRPGYIDCSLRITPMDVPATLSRSEGELHPDGNPHYNIDPRKGNAMADAIAEGLSRVDPSHAALYEKNRDAFKMNLAIKLKEWSALKSKLSCKTAVSHHADMVYFADYMGLRIVQTVEPKPGIAATARHLEEVVAAINSQKIPLIIHEIQYPKDTAAWLMEHTQARVADIATMGSAFPDTQTYLGMIEHNIRSVVETCRP